MAKHKISIKDIVEATKGVVSGTRNASKKIYETPVELDTDRVKPFVIDSIGFVRAVFPYFLFVGSALVLLWIAVDGTATAKGMLTAKVLSLASIGAFAAGFLVNQIGGIWTSIAVLFCAGVDGFLVVTQRDSYSSIENAVTFFLSFLVAICIGSLSSIITIRMASRHQIG
jgi:hypothetical protein